MSARLSPAGLVGLVALLIVPPGGPARGQTAARLPGDEPIERYLRQETERLSRGFLGGAKALPEWEARKPRLRQEYLDMLGLWPLPEKAPLHATVTGTVDRDGVTIEKLHYQSRPGLYVTGNLYRPKKPQGRLPAILYVCGHSGRGRDGNKTAFQDHGTWFARNGYVCLVVDTLQLGEVAGKHHTAPTTWAAGGGRRAATPRPAWSAGTASGGSITSPPGRTWTRSGSA